MKIKTTSGERTVNFPQQPTPDYQHTEHGRTWQWVADPGMWRSVKGGVDHDDSGGGGSWGDITDKPTEFPPEAHTHSQYALQTDLTAESTARGAADDALGLRIDAVEGSIGEGGGFIDAPNDNKLYGRKSEAWEEVVIPDAGASSWNDLTDKPSSYPPSVHNHGISDVAGLQTALDGKAGSTHTHAISDVTGLQTALDDAEYDATQITGDLATETQARIDGDSDLQGQIDAIDSKVDGLPDEKGVVSVNGNTGPAVVLTAADVGALPDTFDGGVDPGTSVGQILRWDGTEWKHTSKVMLDSHGMMTVDSGKVVGDECGLHFDAVTEAILPIDGSGTASGVVDLGSSGSKFYNGHFNGSVSAASFIGSGASLTNLPTYDDSTLLATIADLEARIAVLEAASGGGSLWTDNGDVSISFSGIAKASDFIAE